MGWKHQGVRARGMCAAAVLSLLIGGILAPSHVAIGTTATDGTSSYTIEELSLVSGSAPVDNVPVDIAVDSVNDIVYVAGRQKPDLGSKHGVVTALDRHTGSVVQNLTFSTATAITLAEGRVYVSSHWAYMTDSKLETFDERTLTRRETENTIPSRIHGRMTDIAMVDEKTDMLLPDWECREKKPANECPPKPVMRKGLYVTAAGYGDSATGFGHRLWRTEFSLNERLVGTKSGARPEAFVQNPADGLLYVANGGSHTVSVVRPQYETEGIVEATINVGKWPTGIAADKNGTVYVANEGDATVSVIESGLDGSYSVVRTIQVGVEPSKVAVSPIDGTVYVTDKKSNEISVIRPGSPTVSATIDIGGTSAGIAVTPAGTIYVANETKKTVTVITP